MIGCVIAALPAAVHQRLTGIVERVENNGTGCVHLEHTGTAYLCVQDPRVVYCLRCAAGHVERHTWAEEHACDVCAQALDQGDVPYAALCHPVEVDTTVSLGRGRRAAIGVVVAIGWGACSTCAVTLAVAP